MSVPLSFLVVIAAAVVCGHAAISDSQDSDRGNRSIGEQAVSDVYGEGAKAGDTRELTLPGGVKLKQVWCPPGTFTMGSPANEAGRDEDEDDTAGAGGKPVQVTLTQGYWLGQTEVTQGQWTAVMGMASKPWSGRSFIREGPNFPASCISHGVNPNGTIEADSATAFCEKLTEIERKFGRLPTDWKYALPTEAQWEYACRAGTKTKYSFGDEKSPLVEYAWLDKNASYIGERYAHTVGTKKPNPWGLSDIHGNLWEWCLDADDAQLPGGTDPLVVSSDGVAFRVSRGGCWFFASVRCRSASRLRFLPSYRYSDLGFRLCLSSRTKSPEAVSGDRSE